MLHVRLKISHLRRFICLTAIGMAGAALSSCLSNFEDLSSTRRSGPISNIPTGENEFQIGNLVFDRLNPSNTLNVYGDSGARDIGTFCAMPSAITAGSRTPCVCVFTFTLAGSSQQLEANTDYVEDNLLKCRYDSIPAGASDVEVRVLITASAQYSNGWALNLSGSGSTGVGSADFSDPRTFSRVMRFQCRQNVYVPNLYRRYNFTRLSLDIQGSEQKVYDPFQSHDIRLSYPLNFYARDPGEAMLYLSSATGKLPDQLASWECALNPKDQPPSWLNWRVYSLNADPTDGFEISSANPGDAKKREAFYLSKVSAGIFTTPVNALAGPHPSLLTRYTAPGTSSGGTTPRLPVSDVLKSNPPPLGYAARPTTTAPGEERCPTSAESAIPSGYEWAKLWVFKATTPQRNYVSGSLKIADAGPVVCNPGTWQTGNPAGGALVFQDCVANGTNGTASKFDDHWYIPVPGQNQSLIGAGALAPLINTDNDDVVERSPAAAHDAANNIKTSRSAMRIFLQTDPLTSGTTNVYGACYYRAQTNSAGSDADPEDSAWPALGTGDANPPGTRVGPETLKFGSSLSSVSYLRTGSDLFDARTSSSGTRPLNLDTASAANQIATPIEFNNSGSDVEVSNLDSVSIDGTTPNATSMKYEYLFVVSGTDVHTKDMSDSGSVKARRHTPLRFRNKVDCTAADPNDPSCGTVDSPNRFPPYRLWLGEILADTSAPSSQRPLFPLCVLRKQ